MHLFIAALLSLLFASASPPPPFTEVFQLDIPWAAAGETSRLSLPRHVQPIVRVDGVVMFWSQGGGELDVAPIGEWLGPALPFPNVAVRRFRIIDPPTLREFQGVGPMRLDAERGGQGFSGARIFIRIRFDC